MTSSYAINTQKKYRTWGHVAPVISVLWGYSKDKSLKYKLQEHHYGLSHTVSAYSFPLNCVASENCLLATCWFFQVYSLLVARNKKEQHTVATLPRKNSTTQSNLDVTPSNLLPHPLSSLPIPLHAIQV